MSDALSQKIREARDEAGLTREQMAVALNVSLSTVVRYETGRTQNISAEKLLEVARVTKKPLSFFLKAAAA